MLVVVGVAVGRMVPLPGEHPDADADGRSHEHTRAPDDRPTQMPRPSRPRCAAAPQARQASPSGSGESTGPSPEADQPRPRSRRSRPTAPSRAGRAAVRHFRERRDRAAFARLGPPERLRLRYDRGEYVINKINAALQVAPIVFLNGPYDNTVIAVDVRMMGDVASRYAFLVCRDQATAGQSKQYRASMVPEGRRLILSRWDDGQERTLSAVRDDAAINPGNADNRLELRCAGAKISASVNGKTLVSADDMTLNRGDQGLGAGRVHGDRGDAGSALRQPGDRVP